jgi:hypothetical protein
VYLYLSVMPSRPHACSLLPPPPLGNAQPADLGTSLTKPLCATHKTFMLLEDLGTSLTKPQCATNETSLNLYATRRPKYLLN